MALGKHAEKIREIMEERTLFPEMFYCNGLVTNVRIVPANKTPKDKKALQKKN